MGMMPESREARYSLRGKPQTSWYRAQRVADESLVVRQIAPRPPKTREECAVIREVAIGSHWKLQRPDWLLELDRRPFQSKDQFLETLETDYKAPEPLKVAPKPKKSQLRALAFAELLKQFEDI